MRFALLYLFIGSFSLSMFCQTTTIPDSIVIEGGTFEKVDVEASFPGGLPAWRTFLEKNLKSAVPIDNGAPIGIYSVIAQFIVDKNGVLSDIKALTNFGYGMEGEVIRIIQKSPQWIPARQNGKAVKAYRKQPVTFVVEDEDIDIIINEQYILYTKTDNIVKIKVARTKQEELELSLSQGSIIPAENRNYNIKVNNPGKAILYITHRKKSKQIGSVYFIVKKK